tara:strand:- start:254 stop:439 length:186 start_codon:yes stop_codon:yes gene_type:complete
MQAFVDRGAIRVVAETPKDEIALTALENGTAVVVAGAGFNGSGQCIHLTIQTASPEPNNGT